MQNISAYISQLLFHHECVILPSFGGFVCNYKPAYIQIVQHKFLPPSKQITFNKNLTSNDGLLAHYISKKENCTYNEAVKKIELFVLSLKTKLKTIKEVTLEDIGTFVTDNENRIHFEPSLNENYLLSSYGLPTFQVSPIKRNTYEERMSAQLITPSPNKKINRKKWAVAAILIPLIILTYWIPLDYKLPNDLNYTILNPFITISNKTNYSPRLEITSYYNEDLVLLKDAIKKDSSLLQTYLSFSWIKNEKPIVIQYYKPEKIKIDPSLIKNKKHLQYHVIAGCFSDNGNAKRMVKQLQKKGFSSAWIIGKRKGLWTVSYNSYTSRKKAVYALETAKKENKKAWLLKY